jgi:hypothetical protein
MANSYRTSALETLAALATFLDKQKSPVLLLEGIRARPETDRFKVIAMGRMLAQRLPGVRFRSGNAEGTDTDFAQGVAAVDPGRMEYVMTHAGMGRKRRVEGCRTISLADLPNTADEVVADITLKATPSTVGLLDAYRAGGRSSALGAKGAYLLRDTLKVTGHPESGLPPASAGLFYVNEDDPLSGGTGHTLRVCMEYNVPTLTQAIWLKWLQEGE